MHVYRDARKYIMILNEILIMNMYLLYKISLSLYEIRAKITVRKLQ